MVFKGEKTFLEQWIFENDIPVNVNCLVELATGQWTVCYLALSPATLY